MRQTRLTDLQSDARELGIAWKDIVATAATIDPETPIESARRRAAELMGLRQWRAGLDRQRATLGNTGRDYTAIQGADEVVDTLRGEYPSLSGLDAGDLFDLLWHAADNATACDRYAAALEYARATIERLDGEADPTDYPEDF